MLQACTNKQISDSNIRGKITGAQKQHIFIEELTVNDLLRIDSSFVDDNGNFEFNIKPDEAGIYLLKLENAKFVTLVLDKRDHLDIQSDIITFPDKYKIIGNRGSEALARYFNETSGNQDDLDSLSKVFRSSTQNKDFYKIKLSVDSSFAELYAQQQRNARQLIEEYPNSLASVLLINQQFGNKKLFTVDNDLALMQLIDSCLMNAYPGNSHVVAHHQRVTKILTLQQQQIETEARLAPGQPAPYLSLPDLSGKQVSLQSLQGKLVLINFWASYSPPCRAANIQLKEIHQQYNSKGFEVYAVSFDQNNMIWSDVIKMENFDWINVIDVSGTKSHIKNLYNVPEELPFYYLIDREGKIITKGSRISDIEKNLIEKFN